MPVTFGVVVVLDDVAVLVDVSSDELGIGAPVAIRQPAPGGLNAVILTTGGGRFVSIVVGCVVGVFGFVGVVVAPLFVVVGVVAVVDELIGNVVVGVAAGEW